MQGDSIDRMKQCMNLFRLLTGSTTDRLLLTFKLYHVCGTAASTSLSEFEWCLTKTSCSRYQ